jgi:hypothetical protein
MLKSQPVLRRSEREREAREAIDHLPPSSSSTPQTFELWIHDLEREIEDLSEKRSAVRSALINREDENTHEEEDAEKLAIIKSLLLCDRTLKGRRLTRITIPSSRKMCVVLCPVRFRLKHWMSVEPLR